MGNPRKTEGYICKEFLEELEEDSMHTLCVEFLKML